MSFSAFRARGCPVWELFAASRPQPGSCKVYIQYIFVPRHLDSVLKRRDGAGLADRASTPAIIRDIRFGLLSPPVATRRKSVE